MTLPDPSKALEQIRKGPAAQNERELPPTTVINLDVESEDGRRRYQGRWLFTVPTLGMKIEIGKLKTFYMPQGSAADPEAFGIIEVLAFVSVCCQSVDETGKSCAPPKWYDILNARDFTPYARLYTEAVSYDRRFRGTAAPARDSGDAAAAVEEGSDRGGAARPASDPMGNDVQDPPERRTTLAASRKRGG